MVKEVGFADVHVFAAHDVDIHVSGMVGLVTHMICTAVLEFTDPTPVPKLLFATVVWPGPPDKVGVQLPVQKSATTVVPAILEFDDIMGAVNVIV